MFLMETDAEEIQNIITSFNTNKGTGPCSLPPKILNLICNIIAIPIAKLANISFATGAHPERLKLQKLFQYLKAVQRC